MRSNRKTPITSKRGGANTKGKYIWNHQTLFYMITKYGPLAPTYRVGYYINKRTCDIFQQSAV